MQGGMKIDDFRRISKYPSDSLLLIYRRIRPNARCVIVCAARPFHDVIMLTSLLTKLRAIFYFRFISEMMQDRAIVTMEGE